MHAIRAIYDGVNFTPKQPITVKEPYEVVITFLEPVGEDTPPLRKTRYLLEPDPTKIPTMGELEGTFKVPDDFNEPLDDLKEYMY